MEVTVRDTGHDANIGSYLTTKDLERMFDRSRMTIFNWRRYLDLPYYEFVFDDRTLIRFKLEEVQAWADEKGKYIVRTSQLKGA